ncbi:MULTISPECIES: MoxR family ATPase [Empedobacter]|uniref:AAA family ATPase n=1 Tax=Empedobacter TaxID=59734 RepID=UPI001C58BB1C|nr:MULTISPECIES: MoxR family ATPase [Empedobacter]MBW1618862.1 MoxR family ATPase [Empedobacter falsenii]MBY0066346.1 MoxR family ATPase [Empedobacter falsenii]MDH0675474.1 MoxR family ATPase [Empedobacter sp. GD03861]MDH1602616.1 MoxR family ATPase [Empedobacter sp. GD03739]
MSENTYQPFENRVDFSDVQHKMQTVKNELKKVIVGQDDIIDQLILALLSNGHSLIEGLPGVAKTMMAKLLAKTIDSGFSRIQFTPDLMPSDVIGTSILNSKINEFEFKKGPIFSNIILIDEINRSPAKTQAALFESMSERQVTVDGTTYPLQAPFLVFATQNPIEQEGTYRLPEAQLDRFMFKIYVKYPSLESEIELLKEQQERKNIDKETLVEKVISGNEIIEFQDRIKSVFVHEALITYIATIVHQTRIDQTLYMGASPRASIAILDAAKSNAAVNGRDFVIPEDIKQIAHTILGHRVVMVPEKEMEGFTTQHIIQQIIDRVEIPR